MAYSDGNSVALTPDYGFNISAPTGIQSGGYPVTFAVAVKPAVDASNDRLIGIALSSGNHWVMLQITAALGGASTTTSVTLTTRAGTAGSEVTRDTAASIAEGVWSVVVVKFTDADNWKAVIDDNALETFSTVGGASPANINTFYLANARGVEYFQGSVAWGAVWFSELSDANMQSIAAGTTSPNEHAPNELIYFEGTTAIEGENGSTVNQTGLGSIAEDATDPAGWPPEAEGGGGDREVSANTESLSLSAQAATVGRGRGVSAGTESLSITGQGATVGRGRGVSAGTEALTLTAQNATVSRARGVLTNAQALSLTGQQATVQRGSAKNVIANAEALSLTGQQATVGRGRGVQALLASFDLQGLPATIGRGEVEPVGGHFWQPDTRAERDEKKLREQQELRELIEKAAGLIEVSEEVAEAAEEASTAQPERFIPRPVFKSQVADLKAELNELKAEAAQMRPEVGDSRERINRIVAKATDDIIVRIAAVLTDIIQEIADEA